MCNPLCFSIQDHDQVTPPRVQNFKRLTSGKPRVFECRIVSDGKNVITAGNPPLCFPPKVHDQVTPVVSKFV